MVIDPETGVAVHLNDMTMPQMRAELTYKGLPTEGLKRELTRRLQVRESSLFFQTLPQSCLGASVHK